MYTNQHIKILLSLVYLLVFNKVVHCSSYENMSNNAAFMDTVIVFAGNDTSICETGILTLSELNPEISGLVTDGYWFTMGDGFFNPNGLGYVRYSIGLTYIPGPADIQQGYFDLNLVSDDPDGFGPLLQVNDLVRISLQGNPSLVCHGSLNISLGNNCTETVTPQMLLVNPTPPLSQYVIELTDEDGNVLINNMLTVDEIEEDVIFSIGHVCGSNTCWGTIKPQDKTAPVLQCANYSIDCGASVDPDSIGFPVSQAAIITPISENTFSVLNLDACGEVILSYEDVVQDMACLNGLQDRIIRKWTATDASSNTTNCTQVINIMVKSITTVIFPPNYNDNPVPSLECNGNWPKLPNGNPHPDFTGRPDIDGCSDLEATSTDLIFELCGGSYKILREWLVVDWCTNTTEEKNQVIKIEDSTPPSFSVPDSIDAFTSIYDCLIDEIKIPQPFNIVDCSNVDTLLIVKDTFGVSYTHFVELRKDTFYVDSLPVGLFIASYILTDECNNRDTMSFYITVVDNKIPFAICDQFTKVTVTTSGTARMLAHSIDDNSIDNCAIDSLSVAKMEDLCGNNANVFGPYVDFCCAETAQPVMVALRVTDIYGNVNTCMSQVTIEDKQNPTITCPSDLTISCAYDFDVNDLDIFGTVVKSTSDILPIIIDGIIIGYDGLAEDNCGVTITDMYDLVVDDCGIGTLTRNFTANDLFNNEDNCQQTIQITNDNPFTSSDIMWPANINIDGCDTSKIDINVTLMPTYKNVKCANVTETYKDQYFFDTQEACIKVLRNWTVVNWCVFDANTGDGLYNYAQVIKLDNTTPPTFDFVCSDTTLCIYDIDCGPETFTFDLSGSDDCTDSLYLNYYWEIDEDGNGSIDYTGTSQIISVDLFRGNHYVYAEVIDQCGNSSDCSFNIIAKDCKRPTPYCVSNLTTVVMPSAKEITVIAHTFDYDSYDNCTDKDDLLFSFSSNTFDTTYTITCADITNGISEILMISLYVTDEAGNQDFCLVELTVQDNDDVCQDVGSLVDISGVVTTYKGKKVSDAVVKLESDISVYDQSKVTQEDGAFVFSDLPTNLGYNIVLDHIGSVREEISTFDLILLQRHILGIEKLQSPYQMIAGDANGSKKLNVSDLIAIRKVLLGITNSFAPNVPSWRYVDANHQFDDVNSPYNFDENIFIEDLSPTNGAVDFIGIKIGDINGSIGHLRDDDDASSRSNKTKSLDTKESLGKIEFYGSNLFKLDGFQLNIKVEDYTSIEFHNEIDEYSFIAYSRGELKIICYLPQPIDLDEDENLFTIFTDEKVKLGRNDLSNEIYLESEVYNITLNSVQEELQEKLSINLDYDAGILNIHGVNQEFLDSHSLTIYNVEGQRVYHTDIIRSNQLTPRLYTGIHFVEITGPVIDESFKIIAIN